MTTASPMSLEVKVSRDEVAGWREALLVLALDRWQPLWAGLGVPAAVVAAPAAVQAAAARAWQMRLALHAVRGQGADDHRAMTEDLVRDFLGAVATAHGEAVAIEVQGWARRQFVDGDQRTAYLVWSQVLRRLAEVAGLGAPLVPVPLAPDAVAAIAAIVTAQLGLDHQRADAAALATVARTVAGPLEVEVAAREADLLDSVGEGLAEALTNQRAYQALAAIAAARPGEHDALAAWAREQAVAMGMPPRL